MEIVCSFYKTSSDLWRERELILRFWAYQQNVVVAAYAHGMCDANTLPAALSGPRKGQPANTPDTAHTCWQIQIRPLKNNFVFNANFSPLEADTFVNGSEHKSGSPGRCTPADSKGEQKRQAADNPLCPSWPTASWDLEIVDLSALKINLSDVDSRTAETYAGKPW